MGLIWPSLKWVVFLRELGQLGSCLKSNCQIQLSLFLSLIRIVDKVVYSGNGAANFISYILKNRWKQTLLIQLPPLLIFSLLTLLLFVRSTIYKIWWSIFNPLSFADHRQTKVALIHLVSSRICHNGIYFENAAKLLQVKQVYPP